MDDELNAALRAAGGDMLLTFRADNGTHNLALHAARAAGDVEAAVQELEDMFCAAPMEARPVLGSTDAVAQGVRQQQQPQPQPQVAAAAGSQSVNDRYYRGRHVKVNALDYATAIQTCASAGAWDRALSPRHHAVAAFAPIFALHHCDLLFQWRRSVAPPLSPPQSRVE